MNFSVAEILNKNRVRVYPILFFGLFYSLWLFWILAGEGLLDCRGKIIGSDFLTMYAGSVFAHSTQPWMAYDPHSFHQAQNVIAGKEVLPLLWSYPPVAFLLVWPLSWLPYLLAFSFWMLISAALFIGLLRKILPGYPLIWIVLSSAGFYLNWIQGQNAFLSGALLGWGFYFLEKKPLLGGCLLSLISYKPQMAIPVVLFLVATGKWKSLISMTGSLLALILASLLLFGVESWRGCWEAVSLTMVQVNSQNCPVNKMITAYAAVILAGGTPALAHVLQGMWTLGLTLWIVFLWRKKNDVSTQLALTALAIFFLTPYAFDYELALLLLPGCWLAQQAMNKGWNKGERMVLFLIYFVPLLLPLLALFTKIQLTFILPVILLYFIAERLRSQKA